MIVKPHCKHEEVRKDGGVKMYKFDCFSRNSANPQAKGKNIVLICYMYF